MSDTSICLIYFNNFLGIFIKNNSLFKVTTSVCTRHHCGGKFSLLDILSAACYHYMRCCQLSTAEIKWDRGTLGTECSNY